jgi:hypothetical protein
MKGKDFSEREKEYIRKNKSEKFFNQLAVELSSKFHEDNGGYRSQAAVRRFVKKEEAD